VRPGLKSESHQGSKDHDRDPSGARQQSEHRDEPTRRERARLPSPSDATGIDPGYRDVRRRVGPL
jgi:hypothetical protein